MEMSGEFKLQRPKSEILLQGNFLSLRSYCCGGDASGGALAFYLSETGLNPGLAFLFKIAVNLF